MAPDGAGNGSVDYVMVYKSALTEWCIDTNFYNAHYATFFNGPFYAYGDAVIAKLQEVFPIMPPNQPFIIEVQTPTGGASTGCGFGGVSYCNTVTGDAYYNPYNDPVTNTPIPAFWGYLLTLHEAINVYTGLLSPGWPYDWWADHRSAFPNFYDYEILQALGTAQNNSTLINAALAQKNRMINPANPPLYDPVQVIFYQFFTQFCEGSPCSAFPAYSNVFNLIMEDKIEWNTISGSTRYGALLTEYVIAYLQMGFGTKIDLTQTFVFAGIGSAAYTPQGQIPYTVDPTAVWKVAAAHCSIQAAKGAGQPYFLQLANLQNGAYQSAIASGGTQATCPSECAWNASQSLCVPLWPSP
jgi:hypothetical protein